MKYFLLGALIATCMLTAVVGPATAEWVAKYDDFIKSWGVTDGNQQFRSVNEETAKNQAKAINRAEAKENGDRDDFKDDGDCPQSAFC